MRTMKLPEYVAKCVGRAGGIDKLSRTVLKKDEIKTLSRLFNAASDPIRVKILSLLNVAPLCVCVIKEVLKISDSKISYHLSGLRAANLITDQREGNFIIYQITPLGKRLLHIARTSS